MQLITVLDKALAVFPLLIVTAHAVYGLYEYNHLFYLFEALIVYLVGAILKIIVKKERRSKSYVYTPLPFTNRFMRLKSHYGFPSSHSMFYFHHFLYFPSLPTFLLFLLGAVLRVLGEHHTPTEVLFGCAVTFTVKLAFIAGYRLYGRHQAAKSPVLRV